MTTNWLGQRIRTLRQERGMSLGDLERASGVTKGYLSQLERGNASNPSLDAIKKISRGLDAPLSALSEEPEEPRDDLPPGLQKLVEEARDEGRAIPPEDVEMLVSIRCRGRSPKSKMDWALLYEMIKRVTKR